jgi:hypothetical protein
VQLHYVHVECLTFDVERAHENIDRNAELRTDRRGRHAVLARARLGDDALLAHASREQTLADRIIDLVRARVIEIFALEQQRRSRPVAYEARRLHEGRGPPDEIAQDRVILGPKRRVREGRVHARFELGERFDEHLGHELASEGSKISTRVRLIHAICYAVPARASARAADRRPRKRHRNDEPTVATRVASTLQ